MKCPICGGKMKKASIPNPFGLARTDMYACPDCKVFGSKDFIEKFDMIAHGLYVVIRSLMTLRDMGISDVVSRALKDVKKILLPNQRKKRAKKSN